MPENTTIARANDGRWLPGKTGNPGGRPRSIRDAVYRYAGRRGDRCLKALAVLAYGNAEQRQAFFGESVNIRARDRIDCIRELLDRGWGKPTPIVEADGTSVVIIGMGGVPPPFENPFEAIDVAAHPVPAVVPSAVKTDVPSLTPRRVTTSGI